MKKEKLEIFLISRLDNLKNFSQRGNHAGKRLKFFRSFPNISHINQSNDEPIKYRWQTVILSSHIYYIKIINILHEKMKKVKVKEKA